MRNLTVDLLKHLFDYDKETGNLIWKVSNANNQKIGDIAGSLNPKEAEVQSAPACFFDA